jgi:hypothetical protein
MKFAILPLTAISLVLAAPTSAQSPQRPPAGSGMSDAPRTKREKALGLEGKPRGQRELSAPDDNGNSTEEPDDKNGDLGGALRGAQPSAPQPR